MKKTALLTIQTILLAAVMLTAMLPYAYAEDNPSGGTVQAQQANTVSAEQVINDLLKQGVIDEKQASELMQKYKSRQVQKQDGTPVTQEELVEALAQEIDERIDDLSRQIQASNSEPRPKPVPDWVERIKPGGDLRLRYQGDFYDDDNALLLDPNDPTELLNTRNDRNRLRLRVRLRADVEVSDDVNVGLQLSSGNTTQPTSTNITLGNYFNKTAVLFDQAFIGYKPIPELKFWGGRIPNPWFYTDLVWDNSLNFDGVAVKFDTQIARPLRGFLTLGVFPLQEVELSTHDKWLYGAQTGVTYKPNDKFTARLGVAYYYYYNITGVVNDPEYPNENDWSAPLYMQKGNTLMDIDPTTSYKLALASDYHELDITGMLDVAVFDPVHITLTIDYVRNLGFDRDDVAERTGIDPQEVKKQVTGYQCTLAAGHQKMSGFGQWRGFVTYKHLEADAVVDAFTDATFHGGGTNCEGYILGADFGLSKNVWLSAQYMQSNEIEGPKLAIDTVLVDVNVRF